MKIHGCGGFLLGSFRYSQMCILYWFPRCVSVRLWNSVDVAVVERNV